MTALVMVETVVLAILCVLVAGLLRAYASVLQRLHALDGGGSAAAEPPPFRTIEQVPEPAASRRIEGRDEWQPAHDIEGISLQGEIMTARLVGVPHDSVLAFLSSGCDGCAGFWHELAGGTVGLPTGTRLLVVTKAATEESPAALDQLCPEGVDLVMSSQAWTDFAVPGSPYIVVVDGRTGRIKGEGSGTSFSQIGGLIRQAADDAGRLNKPTADRERESDVDRALLSAGIGPGDPSLYAVAEPTEQRRA
ncbi:MAG: hypothetical protein ABI140_21300 [Jatrophihabitantaceae bacterium]